MAILNPGMDVIERLHISPTARERRLLDFLIAELDDSYEIAFSPPIPIRG